RAVRRNLHRSRDSLHESATNFSAPRPCGPMTCVDSLHKTRAHTPQSTKKNLCVRITNQQTDLIRCTPWVAGIGVLLFLACPAEAQKTRMVVQPGGTQAFQQVLSLANLQPLTAYQDLAKVEPKDTIIIVFGSTAPLEAIRPLTGELRRFLEREGAIMIASDHQTAFSPSDSLREIGIGIGWQVISPEDGFLGEQNCPRIEPTKHG